MPTPIASSAETREVAVTIGDEWFVGGATVGAVFGGLIAAEVVRVARGTLGDPSATLLSLAISYHRRVLPGNTPCAVTTVHRGSRVATVSVAVAPGDRPAATAQAVFGLGAPPHALAPRHPSTLPPLAAPAPGDLSAVVDWRAHPDPWGAPVGDALTAWIRPRGGWRTDEGALDPAWFAIAADLIGPALPMDAPFRVATVSLDLRVRATTASEWLRQRVTARRTGSLAIAEVELSDPAGVVVATASQHAILVPASAAELPASVTAFGWGIPDSSINAQVIGLN